MNKEIMMKFNKPFMPGTIRAGQARRSMTEAATTI